MPSVVERVWADERLAFRAARAALAPLAWTFEAVSRGRALLYDRGIMRARHADVPVVSVGNLRVGGTGKTPLVLWLVERLAERALRAAVVARGYGADGSRAAVISTWAAPVRRGAEADLRGARRLHVDAAGGVTGGDAGDEALLVALRTGAPVVTAIDRHEACRLAVWAFCPDLVLLDDGFQHRRLYRNLDLVLVDPADRTAPLLPAGPLREPYRALGRADVVIANRPGSSTPYLARTPVGLVERVSASADVEPLAVLRNAPVLAVAGIARPGPFLDMLAGTGADVRGAVLFGDHHSYTRRDHERVVAQAQGVRRIVTTEKDLVKLGELAQTEPRLCALRLGVDVEGADALVDLICARVTLDPKQRGQHDREPSRAKERR